MYNGLKSHVGPVRKQRTNTHKMNIYENNTQKIPNLRVYSSEESESKMINADKTLLHVCSLDKSPLENFIFNACSIYKIDSKSVHISIIARKVKDVMNETKYEVLLVTDNAFIHAPRYFKLVECGENFLNNLDTMYEISCMVLLLGKRYT